MWKECPGKGHGLAFPQHLPWIPEAPFCLFELSSVSGPRGPSKEVLSAEKGQAPIFSFNLCFEDASQAQSQKALKTVLLCFGA